MQLGADADPDAYAESRRWLHQTTRLERGHRERTARPRTRGRGRVGATLRCIAPRWTNPSAAALPVGAFEPLRGRPPEARLCALRRAIRRRRTSPTCRVEAVNAGGFAWSPGSTGLASRAPARGRVDVNSPRHRRLESTLPACAGSRPGGARRSPEASRARRARPRSPDGPRLHRPIQGSWRRPLDAANASARWGADQVSFARKERCSVWTHDDALRRISSTRSAWACPVGTSAGSLRVPLMPRCASSSRRSSRFSSRSARCRDAARAAPRSDG